MRSGLTPGKDTSAALEAWSTKRRGRRRGQAAGADTAARAGVAEDAAGAAGREALGAVAGFRGRFDGAVAQTVGQGDFLGKDGLFLADANLSFEGGEGHLETLWLDRKRKRIARFAHPVGPHALATGKVNRLGIGLLAFFAVTALEEIQYRQLAERLEHDRGRHDRIVLKMSLEEKFLAGDLVFGGRAASPHRGL